MSTTVACHPSNETQRREIGNFGVPPEYGQPKEGGTGFLGTPENHRDLLKNRPLSPELFDLEGKPHYKFPLVSISSITNRVTGVMLVGYTSMLGFASVTGNGIEAVEVFKASYPWLVLPTKLAVSYPVLYHYLGGLRHLIWDEFIEGEQTKPSMLSNESVELSSKVLFGTSAVGALGLALYSV